MINKSLFLNVIPSLDRHCGGTSYSVAQLSDDLSNFSNDQIMLLSQSCSGDILVPSNSNKLKRNIILAPSQLIKKTGITLRSELVRIILDYSPKLIHSHGIWNPVNHWTSQISHKYSIPLIIQTQGMLQPWALSHKKLKKQIGMYLFQWKDLLKADLFIATSNIEYENLRKLGLKQPIAIVPNGININLSIPSRTNLQLTSTRKRTILFLSRIHPVKGLINLVNAWGIIRPHNWVLKIAGPDEDNYLRVIKDLVIKLDLLDCIEFIGEVEGSAKSYAYVNADIFVLPTFSENFGIVVAEALAHGVPVITTEGAPWKDLEIYKCGWWVKIGVPPLVEALSIAMNLSDSDRKIMGDNGLNYVKQYESGGVSKKILEVYAWVIGKKTKPDFIFFD